ncbi:hypothetical protein HOH87_05030 [bacterium]|jgi:hypothetical protein|nr:hypothetical protein [bacterium]
MLTVQNSLPKMGAALVKNPALKESYDAQKADLLHKAEIDPFGLNKLNTYREALQLAFEPFLNDYFPPEVSEQMMDVFIKAIPEKELKELRKVIQEYTKTHLVFRNNIDSELIDLIDPKLDPIIERLIQTAELIPDAPFKTNPPNKLMAIAYEENKEYKSIQRKKYFDTLQEGLNCNVWAPSKDDPETLVLKMNHPTKLIKKNGSPTKQMTKVDAICTASPIYSEANEVLVRTEDPEEAFPLILRVKTVRFIRKNKTDAILDNSRYPRPDWETKLDQVPEKYRKLTFNLLKARAPLNMSVLKKDLLFTMTDLFLAGLKKLNDTKERFFPYELGTTIHPAPVAPLPQAPCQQSLIMVRLVNRSMWRYLKTELFPQVLNRDLPSKLFRHLDLNALGVRIQEQLFARTYIFNGGIVAESTSISEFGQPLEHTEGAGSYSGLHKKIESLQSGHPELTDKWFATALLGALEGKTPTPPIQLTQREKTALNQFIRHLSFLLFVTESYRNTAAIVHIQLGLNLISKDQLTWKAFINTPHKINGKDYKGGLMPTSIASPEGHASTSQVSRQIQRSDETNTDGFYYSGFPGLESNDNAHGPEVKAEYLRRENALLTLWLTKNGHIDRPSLIQIHLIRRFMSIQFQFNAVDSIQLDAKLKIVK